MTEEEEEGGEEPRPRGDGAGGVDVGGGVVVVEDGGDAKVADAAEEADEGEEVGCDPDGTEFDHLVPKWVHDIVGERGGVLAAVLVRVVPPEDLRAEVVVRKEPFVH